MKTTILLFATASLALAETPVRQAAPADFPLASLRRPMEMEFRNFTVLEHHRDQIFEYKNGTGENIRCALKMRDVVRQRRILSRTVQFDTPSCGNFLPTAERQSNGYRSVYRCLFATSDRSIESLSCDSAVNTSDENGTTVERGGGFYTHANPGFMTVGSLQSAIRYHSPYASFTVYLGEENRAALNGKQGSFTVEVSCRANLTCGGVVHTHVCTASGPGARCESSDNRPTQPTVCSDNSSSRIVCRCRGSNYACLTESYTAVPHAGGASRSQSLTH